MPAPVPLRGGIQGAVPTLTGSIGQAWRGALARRRCRALRATYTIMACYKRHKVRAYLRELLQRFQAVRSLPDFGKSLPWPEPPAVLERFQEASQCLFRRYLPGLGWAPGTGMWDGNMDVGQGHGLETWVGDME